MGIASSMMAGGGNKPARFAAKGDTIEGAIISITERQLTVFGTDRPETWDDGSPKTTPIIAVQTDQREDRDDTGIRDLYCRGGLYTAVTKALRETYGIKPPADSELIGSQLKIQLAALEPSGRGQPRKVYRARIEPAARSTFSSTDTGGGDNPDDDIPF